MSKYLKKNIPVLRFPEFKEDWSEKILIDIFSKIRNGFVGIVTPFYVDKGIPYLQGKNIKAGEINLKDLFFVSNEFHKKQSSSTVLENDILFVQSGHVGECAVVPKELDNSNCHALIILRPYNLYNSKFIVNLFYSNYGQEKLSRIVTGNTVRHILTSDLGKTTLNFPSLQEQEKIASFLGSVDTRLTQLRRKHELLQTYKRGVMQKLFSQQIRFRGDRGKPFPDWQDKKLSDLFKWVRTNSLSRDALSFESGTIQNIHYGDIHKKFKSQFLLSKEEVPYIIDEIFASNINSEDFCEMGDLVIVDASEDYADIGKAIEIIEVEPNKLVAGLHCFIARPKEKIIVGYSGYLFKSEDIRKQIKKIAQGISVLGISKTNLEHLNVPLPCIEEQSKIAGFLTAIDQKIEAVAKQIELTEQFKKGLLQKMFV